MPVLGKMKRRPDVVCDVFIPASRFARFWDWYREVFDFWPLWVVPHRPAEVYPWIGAEVRERLDSELFIDLAVYGASNSARDRDLSVLLEEAVWDLGGIKTLIGRNHYERERFWRVYDREAYESAKKQLDPDGSSPTSTTSSAASTEFRPRRGGEPASTSGPHAIDACAVRSLITRPPTRLIVRGCG